MRIPSCTRGFTLASVATRKGLLLVALIASLAVIPSSADAASKKHRLKAFTSCSRFVHFARDHAPRGIATRGIPVDGPIPVTRTPTPMNDQQQVAMPESAPTAGGGAGQDFSTTNVQEQGVDEPD